jgi:nucleoside-diphosphate-sugar epimerase
MRIAITGAAGHVGSAVSLHALSEGHHVLGLDLAPTNPKIQHAEYEYKQLDALDFKAFEEAVELGRCDALIHLATVFNPHDGHGNLVGVVGEQVSEVRLSDH